jgi:hypothetical protein
MTILSLVWEAEGRMVDEMGFVSVGSSLEVWIKFEACSSEVQSFFQLCSTTFWLKFDESLLTAASSTDEYSNQNLMNLRVKYKTLKQLQNTFEQTSNPKSTIFNTQIQISHHLSAHSSSFVFFDCFSTFPFWYSNFSIFIIFSTTEIAG